MSQGKGLNGVEKAKPASRPPAEKYVIPPLPLRTEGVVLARPTLREREKDETEKAAGIPALRAEKRAPLARLQPTAQSGKAKSEEGFSVPSLPIKKQPQPLAKPEMDTQKQPVAKLSSPALAIEKKKITLEPPKQKPTEAKAEAEREMNIPALAVEKRKVAPVRLQTAKKSSRSARREVFSIAPLRLRRADEEADAAFAQGGTAEDVPLDEQAPLQKEDVLEEAAPALPETEVEPLQSDEPDASFVTPEDEQTEAEPAPHPQETPQQSSDAFEADDEPDEEFAEDAEETEDVEEAEEADDTEESSGAKAPLGRRVWAGVRRVLPTLLATLVYLLLALWMFSNLAAADRGEVVVSLRYNTPLDKMQVAGVKHTLGDPERTPDFAATFWQDSPAETLSTKRGEATTPTLFVDGDMAAALRVDFVYGGYPSALEKRGLALSEGLAWELFGGTDIVGGEVEWNGAVYVVRGVFKGDELMLLAQIEASEAPVAVFSGVELSGGPGGDPRQAAATFATNVGLGEPSAIVNVRTLPGLMALLAWLPVVILGIWFVVWLVRLLHHVVFWKRQLAWLGLLLAGAFLLPRALDLLPGWMIPSQWSNLDYWSGFLKEIKMRVTEWLSLRPYFGDVQFKKQLILQVLLTVPAMFAMAWMIRRWGAHMRRMDAAIQDTKTPDASTAMENAAAENDDALPTQGETEEDDVLLLKGEAKNREKKGRME